MIDRGLFAALSGSLPDADRIYGVVIGVVTNNQDPDGLGRVKLRFPWLSRDHESPWARVISPMAGKERGLYALPEVDDEVLVAFEHGRIDFPYVLGALWNGKDKPPGTNDDGKNSVRLLKSRSGHVIRLDDTEGGEKIEIVDAKGKQSIVFDVAASTLTITADTIELTARKGVEINSAGEVNIKGSVINLN